ncbi:MAG: hypothetical protein KGP28_11030 [Bdellovibrionales bacterium]|nr:hypothetical protein [Bdellovibrionales bacterium]
MNEQSLNSTPISVIATVSRLVTRVTDRITGDRSEFPLLVATVTTEALRHCGIGANAFYGEAAWIEVMENQSVMWVGCWGENSHFWTVTTFGEIVDLNTSVSHRKRSHQNPDHQPKFSPPLLWSKDVPSFYRYKPGGIAEVDLDSERDRGWFELCLKEVVEKIGNLESLMKIPERDLDFPDEAILCPGRRILDDGAQSFRHFDRALSVHGIPKRPF